MSDATKTVLTRDTLVPLSFVITFVVLIASGIVSHTTHSNQIEVMRAEIAEIKSKYISRELFDTRFGRIEEDIREIKELLKSKNQ